ncbi:hypothetical protein [Mycolicibacterium sp. P1-5]|uniref:hypothetical protein n=1 Tax=Mycolicibacterium sp. P1-5 TaxID=2024617 RepID=UPI0011EEA7BA|nr:hypothetical protein [Mycolicibacterium sp. P1-5]KAA0111097.1 hypothetical protein CIW47_03950 [Mycolicibacterium sp. P1-5]
MTNPADFPEEGGPGDTLSGTESLDSDEVRNADGDEVVDPPDGWSGATKFGMTAREERQGESLDAKLGEEEPDAIDDIEPDDTPADRAHHGQVSGTPEDGDSLYPVTE